MNENDILFTQLKSLSISVTENTYTDCVQQGYSILVKLYDLGLTEQHEYQQLLKYHNSLQEGLSKDWLADMMDFVVGWCAPQLHIWRKDDKFDRTK